MTDRMTAAQFKSTRKKPVDREGPVQIEIVNWLRSVLPDGCLVHHVKNEIKRGGGTYAREQAKAKRMGLIPGWPDLIICTYVGVYFLEVKSPTGKVQPHQKAVHADLRRLGLKCAVVRSVADTREFLHLWGIGFVDDIELRGTI